MSMKDDYVCKRCGTREYDCNCHFEMNEIIQNIAAIKTVIYNDIGLIKHYISEIEVQMNHLDRQIDNLIRS